MAYITPKKVTPQQVLALIKHFKKEYDWLPLPKQLAKYFGVVPQTIYNRLNELERTGKIERIKVKRHNTSYKLK